MISLLFLYSFIKGYQYFNKFSARYNYPYFVLLTQQSMVNGVNCRSEIHTVCQSVLVLHHQCSECSLSNLASSWLPNIPGTANSKCVTIAALMMQNTYQSIRGIRLKCKRAMEAPPPTRMQNL